MTRQETISKVCAIVGLVFQSRGDFSQASDCFCDENQFPSYSYQNGGGAIEYIRMAVVQQLIKDGYTVKGEV